MTVATLHSPPKASAAAKFAYDGGLTCSLNVTNLDRAIAWYQTVLGFNLLYRLQDVAWAELATAVGRVNLGLGEVEHATPKGGATLTFGVIDIEAAKAMLDTAGIRQDGPIRDIPGMVRLLTFFDPDDNALMFYQDITGQPPA